MGGCPYSARTADMLREDGTKGDDIDDDEHVDEDDEHEAPLSPCECRYMARDGRLPIGAASKASSPEGGLTGAYRSTMKLCCAYAWLCMSGCSNGLLRRFILTRCSVRGYLDCD